jgi:chitodextrinase
VLPPENTYTLSVEVVGNGSVVAYPDQVSYVYGSVVNLSAYADEGWVFDHWGGDLNGSASPTDLIMDSNKTVIAYFRETEQRNEYWLNVGVIGNGSVLRDPDLTMYPAGTEVQLTALADPGWVFDHWAGNLSGNASTRSLTMDANKSVSAYFLKEHEEPTQPSSHGPSVHHTNIVPVADAGGPYDALLGQDMVMNGLGSFDPDGFLIHFSWSFGDGTTGTGATVVHRYLMVGTYQVTLTVVDNLGGLASNTTMAHIVVQNHPPSNPVIMGPSEGVKGTEYSYSFSCSDPENDILRYRIDWGDWTTFPDGIFSSGESFVLRHHWASPGTYTITMVASDGEFSSSSIKIVTIRDTLVVSNIAIIVLNLLLLLVLILVYLASRRKVKHE